MTPAGAYEYVISLGCDCFPRHFVDLFGLQSRFPVRMPFDGNYTPIAAVYQLLLNDFKDFTADEFLVMKRDEAVGGDVAEHTKYGIKWVHEPSYERFKEMNRRRVAEFDEIASRDSILFFCHADGLTDPRRLCDVMRGRYPSTAFKLFVLGTRSDAEPREAERYYRCDVPFPPPPYVYWRDELRCEVGRRFYAQVLHHFLKASGGNAEEAQAMTERCVASTRVAAGEW